MNSRSGPGRPRSEAARTAVLHAVDDLLVEEGYAAMTMKGIAERAGVGRQTVYRWWATKAEILWEAVVIDARKELAAAQDSTAAGPERYVERLLRFLTESDAGAGYRALVGEAQHDPAVARLIDGDELLFTSARPVVTTMAPPDATAAQIDAATAVLVGPVLAWALTGRDPATLPVAELARACRAVFGDFPSRGAVHRRPRRRG